MSRPVAELEAFLSLSAERERKDLPRSRLVYPKGLRVLDHGLLDGQCPGVDPGDEAIEVQVAGAPCLSVR